MKAGFIGLGNMGGPMVEWLLKAGVPTVVHDLREESAVTALDMGATWAGSAAEVAAQCDVVCTCLPGPPEMEAVYLGAGGVLEGIQAGGICVDHTTNSPDTVRKVGAAVEERGGHLLDAPMDGGKESSLAGQMTLFVGGDEAVLDRARPVLDCYSANVVLVGDLGTGSITKIVHNALANSIDLLVAECMTLGVKAGVTMPNLVNAFNQGCIVSQNLTFTQRMPATLFKGDFTARFALKLAHKDYLLARQLAQSNGVPTRLVDLCQDEILEAMNRGWGESDRIRASTLQEERAGVQLRLDPAS
jgi:3-hydroxyisobutyrate dehydrogenase